MKRSIFYILVLMCVAVGCTRHSMPKPYGYYRITAPNEAMCHVQSRIQGTRLPYDFDVACGAQVKEHRQTGEMYWLDVHYPWANVDLHCSYKPIQGNLRELTDDAIEFVYKHASHATAIPEREFANDEAHVYGVFFALEGNTASPFQFILTDSVHHFFRGAVYCNCRPNADSLSPVYDYFEENVMHLMESFYWK